MVVFSFQNFSRDDSTSNFSQSTKRNIVEIKTIDRLVARSVEFPIDNRKRKFVLVKIAFVFVIERLVSFRFIAGKTLFVFNYLTVKKNEPLVFSSRQNFQFFEQNQNLRLSIGPNRKLCLKDLLDDLKRTQHFVDNSN